PPQRPSCGGDRDASCLLCDGSRHESFGCAAGAENQIGLPQPPASPVAAATEPLQLQPQRHTFRAQSKLRLMHLGAPVGRDDDASASYAAVCEQDALLALLGSSRMLSSVLTATSGPSVASDPAVHGVRDPRYDHTGRFAVIPEHAVSLVGSDDGTVVGSGLDGVGVGATADGALFGNTRMGSTVFSPPMPAVSRLAASMRRLNRRPSSGSGGNGGSGSQRPPRSAARAAMPDLKLLSRRMGSSTIIGPDGRPVSLVSGATDSVRDTQLELPPPEELVSAVNGHQVPLRLPGASQRRFGGGGGGGGGSHRRRFAVSQADEPTAASSDESEDRPLRGALRSFKVLTAPGTGMDGPRLRGSSSGNSLLGSRCSNNGGGGGGNSGVVPALIRHLSAPARRLTLTSNSGQLLTGG
ncbi:hypothetical protein Vretifemale_4070, partial [Volvox reticuliferus]